ncbi:MAG: glycine cleavage system protein GcvH [Candidatus Aenigmatarchaeota archaeon]
MEKGKLPNDLLYNKDYSWVKVEGEIAIVGVTEPAAKKVKEFVFIKLPEKGRKIKKGETYVSLEAVKWSGHLSSPVSGEVIDVNEKLFDEPSLINKDPYGSWIMKVKISDKSELKSLMKAKEIEKWMEENV